MQSGHGSAPPASGVVHGHPDRWCSRHCRRPSRALRRVCAVSNAARQFDVQPVFAALAICSRCETRLIPEQRWPVQPPASSVSCSRVVQPATSPSPCRTSASARGWLRGRSLFDVRRMDPEHRHSCCVPLTSTPRFGSMRSPQFSHGRAEHAGKRSGGRNDGLPGPRRACCLHKGIRHRGIPPAGPAPGTLVRVRPVGSNR